MAWAEKLWDASYKDVHFFCRLTEDRQPRAVAVAEYPYRDGGHIEDLGRGPRNITIQVVLFGSDYEDELAELVAILDETGSGELIHPIFGPVNAKCTDYVVRHDGDHRDSATIDITFKEDAIDTPGIIIRDTAGSTADAAFASATGVAALLNATERAKYMAKINNALSILRSPDRVIPGLREASRALQDVQNVTNELVGTYRTLTDPENFTIVRGFMDTYALFGKLFQRTASTAPPYRQEVVSAPISARALAVRLYGDASRASEIISLNNLTDPSFIPAGTALTVRAS